MTRASLRHQNRGQIRMLEAFLAILLVSSALILSAGLSPPESAEKETQLTSLGIQALLQLDENGRLGVLIDARNWTMIGACLREVLPFGTIFNLTVYDETSQIINNVAVTNGVLDAEAAIAVEYVCASQGLKCQLYLIRLQLSKTR